MDIYERANYECEICDGVKGLQKHHIVKRSQLGPDTPENIILLCWDCHHGNEGIHGRDGNEFDRQLRAGLEQHYLRNDYDNVKKLMGGKLILWDTKPTELIKNHFRRLENEI